MELPHPTLGSIIQLVGGEIAVPRNELNILLAWVLKKDRVGLIRDSKDPIPLEKVSEFKAAAKRRERGEPIAYITGSQEFYSRLFEINPNVLIPRPETEELVERALEFLQRRSTENLLTTVLDVGCGSGAIAITMALENPLLEVTAIDISQDAIDLTQSNANLYKVNNLKCLRSDLFNQLKLPEVGPRFDLIVSNPPYIPNNDPHLSQGDLRFEPVIALTDFADGLTFYQKLAQQAGQWIKTDGAILVEHGFDQQEKVCEIFRNAGFMHVEGFKDLSGHPRMVLAQTH